MRMIRRLYSLLALLLVGSAGLRAQSSDPFPDVESHKYENNMIIRGQVRQNGVALGSDAVVAVYCGDEIRGKGRPFSDKNHTNIFQFVVHGDGNTNGDPLIFKVYTGGKIIEVDQGPRRWRPRARRKRRGCRPCGTDAQRTAVRRRGW